MFSRLTSLFKSVSGPGEPGGRSLAEFLEEAKRLIAGLSACPERELGRQQLLQYVTTCELYTALDEKCPSAKVIQIRDCARVWRSLLSRRSERLTGFSLTQVLIDLAQAKAHDDLTPAFFADLIRLLQGLEGRGPELALYEYHFAEGLTGRELALSRSLQLDKLAEIAEHWLARYPHGLSQEVAARRAERAEAVLKVLNGDSHNWHDWRWQVAHIVKDTKTLKSLLPPGAAAAPGVAAALDAGVPFGVTPFYLSLMDSSGADAALRAQVLPSREDVEQGAIGRAEGACALDFMQEGDTSPVDLVTRRYPSIAILKPFNTCPQICVYCQRNWEIEEAMAPSALAPLEKIEAAIDWIAAHPAIREVLITGGDPLAMDDEMLETILKRLSAIPAIERIRIGTRVIVTMPMRITDELVDILRRYRKPAVREVAVVTHVEHPYEINRDMAAAVEKLRLAGISVYNQLVYTFYNSRRFEASALRRLLKRIGIDPYYTFSTKGKEETAEFRVPIARLLQELKEEARMLPGLERTDTAVFNLPRLGKNYLRAQQHHDLLAVLPDGSRMYEFHPWEKNIARQETYLSKDVPILTYLERLARLGEDVSDYESIWYYF